ncbi:MAG: polyprenol phosphomannose-dependent alpha 1,6 mannosyltransferase MptB [Acidobacteria bacterium]|nr:polyprenol phosphomannose-dependent alpha 1,6 mannosyltransferase MptB [Acidobacteriota bacterium]
MPAVIDRVRRAVDESPQLSHWAERLRELVLGHTDTSDAPRYEQVPWQAPVDSRPRPLQTILFALSGVLGGLVIAASAPVWRLAVPNWRITVPGIAHPGSALASTLWFLLGLVLLAIGWLGLIARAGRIPDPRRALIVVGVVIALWAIPVSLGPPLLSNDVYSYVAQGEMASRGIDPGSTGPVALGRNDWTSGADPVWRAAAAPYGPVAVFTSRTVVEAAGHDPAVALWLYRVVVAGGILMAGIGVSLIAQRSGVSPAVAVAIGIGNPIVILHLIGGAHNDALMFGFLALGLAAAQRGRRVLGAALLIAATAIKLPAALGLVYLGWCWDGAIATTGRRILTTARVMGAAVVAIALGCVLMGMGPGWLTALTSTGKVNDTYSPTTKLGFSISELLGGVGIDVDGATLTAGVRAIGLLLVVLLALVVMIRSPRIGVVRATGVMLVAYVILGPVIWPWYLAAGFALLAAGGLGRYQPAGLVVCIAASWFVWPTSVVSIQELGGGYQHLRGLGVVILVIGLAWAAQRFASRWERRAHPAMPTAMAQAIDER